MKNTIIFLFFLYQSISLLAQEAPNVTDANGKKQGAWIKLDENKKKLYEGTFKDDIPVGKFIYYYDNGMPYSIVEWSNKGKVGRTKMYEGGGKLVAEGKYVNQKKDSIWVFYNQEGKLLSTEPYNMGLKNGTVKTFYANGQVAEEKIYKNDLLEGPIKKYFPGGEKKYESQYVNNKVEGKTIYYNPDGRINAIGVYKNDLKEGEWKYYSEDGKLLKTDKYIEGKMLYSDKDYIPKEQADEEKMKFQNFEVKDPFQEGQ